MHASPTGDSPRPQCLLDWMTNVFWMALSPSHDLMMERINIENRHYRLTCIPQLPLQAYIDHEMICYTLAITIDAIPESFL